MLLRPNELLSNSIAGHYLVSVTDTRIYAFCAAKLLFLFSCLPKVVTTLSLLWGYSIWWAKIDS
jgi:hypothetical protein